MFIGNKLVIIGFMVVKLLRKVSSFSTKLQNRNETIKGNEASYALLYITPMTMQTFRKRTLDNRRD